MWKVQYWSPKESRSRPYAEKEQALKAVGQLVTKHIAENSNEPFRVGLVDEGGFIVYFVEGNRPEKALLWDGGGR